MTRYSEKIKNRFAKKFQPGTVKEKSVTDMESAVIRYRAGAVSDRRQSFGRRCLYVEIGRGN